MKRVRPRPMRCALHLHGKRRSAPDAAAPSRRRWLTRGSTFRRRAVPAPDAAAPIRAPPEPLRASPALRPLHGRRTAAQKKGGRERRRLASSSWQAVCQRHWVVCDPRNYWQFDKAANCGLFRIGTCTGNRVASARSGPGTTGADGGRARGPLVASEEPPLAQPRKAGRQDRRTRPYHVGAAGRARSSGAAPRSPPAKDRFRSCRTPPCAPASLPPEKGARRALVGDSRADTRNADRPVLLEPTTGSGPFPHAPVLGRSLSPSVSRRLDDCDLSVLRGRAHRSPAAAPGRRYPASATYRTLRARNAKDRRTCYDQVLLGTAPERTGWGCGTPARRASFQTRGLRVELDGLEPQGAG